MKLFKTASVACAAAMFATSAFAGHHQTNDEMSVRLGGRVNVNFAYFDDDSDGTRLPSGAHIRRARLFGAFKYGQWFGKVTGDFADDSTILKEAYFGYKNLFAAGDAWTDWVIIGQRRTPEGLDHRTSSKHLTFAERAMVANAWDEDRRIGLFYGISNHQFQSQVAVVFDNALNDDNENDDIAFFGNAAYALYNRPGEVLHFGVNASWRDLGDNGIVAFGDRPEFRVDDTPRFVEALINGDNAYTFGAEIAAIMGAFSAQAEYAMLTVDDVVGIDDDFEGHGWYVQVSWFVTGQHRGYSMKKAAFVRPHGIENSKNGAVEVGVRYSYLDLEDEGIGNKGDNITAGINWYVNNHIRFMLNYIFAQEDRSSDEADHHIVGLAAQAYF